MSPALSVAMKHFSVSEISHQIHFFRGHRVMLDSDLAVLYGVETKALTRAVRRNIDRFPGDFMFELTREEAEVLRRQFGTSKPVGHGGRRYLPLVFTEQGVAMLSSVLRSKSAIYVNIEIMRAFVRVRQIMEENRDLAKKLTELEEKYDVQFKVVFDAIRQMIAPSLPENRRKIGLKG
jgi:hypothetical protein